MNIVKRAALLLAVLIIAAADILIYLNTHLYNQADKVGANEKKIEIFERSNKLYPLNDLVYYGLGKAYLNVGTESLGSPQGGGTYFKKADEHLRFSLRLNPTSPFSHFYLAQSLFNLSVLSGSSDKTFLEEYKKAGELTEPNTQVYYEVGKTYLSLWNELSDQERNYTLDLVKKILEGKNKARIASLMNTWAINVGNFEFLESLLPRDAEVLRLYADFLGERAIFIEPRQKSLAAAEALEFDQAKSDYQSGESEAFYYQWEDAERQFNSCFNKLKKINFYQDLVSQNLIDASAYVQLRRSALLNLIKCRLGQGKKLSEVENDLREYLSLEDKAASVGKLETYLVERGLISAKPSGKFDDLELLSFQLILFYKQNRYGEILDLGRLLQNSFVVIPEGKKSDYLRVLQVVGDSFQKLDYLYEANDFYKKALELDPKNLETLVRIRQNYANLNNDLKVQEVNLKIKELISGEINLKNYSLEKGEGFSQALILDGQKMVMELSLKEGQGLPPVISVFFNDRVVWENTVAGENISIPVQSKVGKNIVKIISLNRPVSLLKLVCRYGNEGKT